MPNHEAAKHLVDAAMQSPTVAVVVTTSTAATGWAKHHDLIVGIVSDYALFAAAVLTTVLIVHWVIAIQHTIIKKRIDEIELHNKYGRRESDEDKRSNN